ncbi:MAG TPA: GNAT family N-acetyltransferase [Candidatus Baltobacteraceae bacterium]
MGAAIDEFHTPRLRGVRFRPEHLPELCELDEDPVIQSTLFGTVFTQNESQARLQRRIEHWDTHGFGDYVVYLKDGTFIGTCAIFTARMDIDDGPQDTVAIGYVLKPEFWNQGYATEMSRAALRIAFEDLELPCVYAAALPENAASRRVMEKCGMTYVREFLYQGRWLDVLYAIDRERWLLMGATQQRPALANDDGGAR